MSGMRTAIAFVTAPLIVLALVAAAGRASALATGGEPFAAVYGLFPPTAVEDARLLDRWFADRAALTWTHIVSGAVVLLLAPLQFLAAIRRRWPALHRWTGRITLLAALPAGVTGWVLQASSPYGGPVAGSAIAIAGLLFLGAGLRAYQAIRRRDFVKHRQWMIRLLAVGLGVGTVRVVAIPLILVTGRRPIELMGITFWLGFAIPILVGEWWIRSSSDPGSWPVNVAVSGGAA